MKLDILILLIALGGVVSYLATKVNKKSGAWVTVIVSIVALALMYTFKDVSTELSSFSMIEFKVTTYGWFFAMVMLITYAAVSLFNPYWMEKLLHPAAYNLFYLLSLAGTIGLFFSKNFITLFIFWEVVVWASMFIIPLGKSRKAAVVYYTISAIGSFAMLYGIMLLYSKYNTLDISEVFTKLASDPGIAVAAFFLIVLAGLTKLGIFPFHIWLPIAHGNAPHTFSPVLSGGLVKMGGFIGFLVVAVMPSLSAFASHLSIRGVPFENYILLILGSISIVVGTLMAIKQEDAKKLIAYSTVSNSGYILIGIGLVDQIGLAGGMMHVFNHAMASAAMFLAMAAVAYRTGTTKMSELGGLIKRMPVTFTTYLIAIISLAGIPPMSGFISKWLIFQSLSKHGMVFIALAAFFGSVGSFLYVFRPLSAVFLGQLSDKHKEVKEVPFVMQLPMYILSILTIFFGTYPQGMLDYIGRIQNVVGISPIQVEGTKIIAANGGMNTLTLTIVFGFGFLLALIGFMILPKKRTVDQMDIYTSGEFVYTPELQHYSYSYYAPFERLYSKHPSVEKLFGGITLRIHEFGQLISTAFFNFKPGVTVVWISIVVTIIYLWGGRI